MEEVHLGDVMGHVVVKVGAHRVESLISRASPDELNLQKGAAVQFVVKPIEVIKD